MHDESAPAEPVAPPEDPAPTPAAARPPRRHDLDALRAVAMLLGIALHGALSFVTFPWLVQDSQQHSGFGLFFFAVHGFRMPIFFLMSGFFTAMLWRQRGLRSLLWQRFMRVFLPCMVGLFTIVPVMWVITIGILIFSAGQKATTTADRQPDAALTYYPVKFEWPAGTGHPLKDEDSTSWPPDQAMENYAWVIQGYFYPREDGIHYFAIASDDTGELWLSPDDDFDNLRLIAVEPKWSWAPRSFAAALNREMVDQGTPHVRLQNQSRGIHLEAGKAYAIKATCHDLGLGEKLAVAFNTTGPKDFYDKQDPIPGDMLSPMDAAALSQPRVGTPIFAEEASRFRLLLKDGLGPHAKTITDDSIDVTLGQRSLDVTLERDGPIVALSGPAIDEDDSLMIAFSDSTGATHQHHRSAGAGNRQRKAIVSDLKAPPPSAPVGRIGVREFPKGRGWSPPKRREAARDSVDSGKEDERSEARNEQHDDKDPVKAVLQQVALGLMAAPIFHHLWFLWFLCWLVVGFAMVVKLGGRLFRGPPPRWLILSPARYLWLIPLTMVPALTMVPDWLRVAVPPGFGPDTSIGLIPMPHILTYYAIFFGFGALYYDCNDTSGKVGRLWWLTLPLALLVILPVGLEVTFGYFGFRHRLLDPGQYEVAAKALQATYAWTMTFGLMGLFRRLLPRESGAMRYLSDSSYWLYLAHLPLILMAQYLVKGWPLPALVKFILVCGVTTGLLLVVYQTIVRYTFIGTFLNGPRHRPGVEGQL